MQWAGLEEGLAPPLVGGTLGGLADGGNAESGAPLLAALGGSASCGPGRLGADRGDAEGQSPALGVGGNGPCSEEDDQRQGRDYDRREDEWRRHVPYKGQLPTSTSKGKTMLLP